MPGATPESTFAAVTPPPLARPARVPPALDSQELAARRARARTYYVALAVAALVVAGVLVWQLLPR
jgi:hypothetical protein